MTQLVISVSVVPKRRVITAWEIIKFNHLSNTATSRVSRDNAFRIVVFSVVTYARTFGKEYETPSIEERIGEIVD